MPNIEAHALAATLRACVREGEPYEAITRASLLAADLLERQATQLAALRTGADTEDLHAAFALATDLSRQLGEADARVRDARRQALEEAAGLCDGSYPGCAAAIRALADKPAAGGADD